MAAVLYSLYYMEALLYSLYYMAAVFLLPLLHGNCISTPNTTWHLYVYSLYYMAAILYSLYYMEALLHSLYYKPAEFLLPLLHCNCISTPNTT